VTALDEALHYLTPQTAPLDYARAQANLGLARQDLGDRAGAVACWREAAEHFQRMGETAKAELMLELIAAANPDQTR
jgi:tetratricopeptide (TPR) repeat protein